MTVKIRYVTGRDGKTRVRLDIDYKGIRKYKTIGLDTPENRDRAEDEKAQLESGLRYHGEAALKGPEKARPCPKFKDYALNWLNGLRGLKQSTLQSYKGNLDKHLIPAFGTFALDEIDYRSVKLFLQAKQRAAYPTRHKLKKGQEQVYRPYSKDALRLMRATLRVLLEEAVSDGYLTTNPAAPRKLTNSFRQAPKLKEKIRPWTEGGLIEFEDWLGGKFPQYYEIVMVMSRAGLRIGEAVALEWTDLDFDQVEIDVNKNLPIGRDVTTPKTARSTRKVPMSADLVDALTALKARRRAEWFAKGQDMPDIVFCNEAGGYLLYPKFRARFKKASDGRTPHDLRHTFASLLLAAGVPVAEVAKLLGHSSPLTTYRIYAHWIPDASKTSAVDRIGRKKPSESAESGSMGVAKKTERER